MNAPTLFKGLTIPHPPTLEQVQAQNATARHRYFVWSVLASLVSGIAGGFIIWIWKESGQWEGYWNINSLVILLMLSLLPAGFLLSGMPSLQRARLREEMTRALALRQAAWAGEETSAPEEVPQPHPLECEDLPTSLLRLGPLRRVPEIMHDSHFPDEIAISGFGIAGFLVFLALVALNQSLLVDLFQLLLWPLALGALLIAWSWRQAIKKVTITVEEQGLCWKARPRWWPHRTSALAWQDVRAFYTFDYEQRSSLFWKQWRLYVLDAPEATLAWGVIVPPPFAPPTRSAEQTAHEHLARLIVTRTGLPLRTLKAAAKELAKDPIERVADQFGRQALSAETALATLHTLNERPAQSGAGRRRRWSLAAPPLALLVLLPLAAWGIQTYQSEQYASLLAQVHAHRPLYTAAAIGPDSFHDVSGPSDLPASQNPLEATAPAVYGDAAVEVIVRLPHGETYADFGLILHTDGAANAEVVFRLNLDGFWALGPIDADPGVLIRTDTPDTRPGASNRLTVIMRGTEYICYVNGTFVAVYHAAHPSSGHVGALVMDSYVLDLATFTDFTVYPL